MYAYDIELPYPSLHHLLLRARRRLLAQLILDKAALALTIAMGGAVVLLIAGTQILDWYWLLLLAAAGFGAGLYRLRGRIPLWPLDTRKRGCREDGDLRV